MQKTSFTRRSDKVIVSFASKGRENYPKAQLRLVKSCALLPWNGDYMIRCYDGYCDEYHGIPILLGKYPSTSVNSHAEVPYGFKPDIILEAIEAGYKQIVWADSTIVVHQDIQPVLDYAKKYGVAAFDNVGHPLWPWISDIALEHLQLTEEDLKKIPQIMACALAFDVTNDTGLKIFEEWYRLSRDGVSFQNYGSGREGFRAHRHDQAVLSGILWKHQVPLMPYGRLVYHPHEKTGEFGNEIYFVNKGVEAEP